MDSLFNKVLITGAAGFTGKYLKVYLEKKNFSVIGIAQDTTQDNSLIYCDITNRASVIEIIKITQPNYIIHLAGISFVQHENLSQMYQVNILGTENILEACKEAKFLKKIILASSATVYGNQETDTYHEELCPNPVNHYGISKYGMEQIAKNYFEKLPILITRPFNYTAPGQSINFIIPKIASAFNEKKTVIELGNINTFREYNSIEFICNAYHELMISNSKSEIYNLASGKTYSLNEILNVFEEITQHKIEVIVNPKFVRLNEIVKLAGSTSKLDSLIKNKYENNIYSVVKSFIS